LHNILVHDQLITDGCMHGQDENR